MKAAALTKKGRFEIIEREIPEINNDFNVLVRVLKVGVCGSDIHYFKDGRIGDQVIEYPFIPGHEAMGVVEKCGLAVKDLQPGQRIAIEPSVHCGKCDQCKSGREHTCREGLFLGCPGQLEGCLQEYIILPEENCIPIDDSVSDDQAVIAEPMSIAQYTVDRSGIKKDQSAVVMGFGPIGMSVYLSLRSRGVDQLIVAEKLDDRINLAKKEKADLVLNSDSDNLSLKLKVLADPGYDFAFECSGDPKAIDTAIKILKPGGKLVIVGIPEIDEIELPIHVIRRKEIDIINIRRQVNCVEKAIQAMSTDINIKNMVTHNFSLDETQKAFELVAGYKDAVVKAMINI